MARRSAAQIAAQKKAAKASAAKRSKAASKTTPMMSRDAPGGGNKTVKSFGAFAVTGSAHSKRATVRMRDTSKATVRGVDPRGITTIHTVRTKNKLTGVKASDIPAHKRTKRSGSVTRRVR